MVQEWGFWRNAMNVRSALKSQCTKQTSMEGPSYYGSVTCMVAPLGKLDPETLKA